MAPAAKVCVPMNFGRHHLKSPTHSNLTLNLEEGKKSRANSLILSFNSPVIERLVSTLEITSLDMDDFQESAVRCFVDCCYTGDVELLDRNCFRDVNKMAKVFQVDWLTRKCNDYFSRLGSKLLPRTFPSKYIRCYKKKNTSCSYEDMFYLFEEASHAFITLKQFQLINWIIFKMNPSIERLDDVALENMKKCKTLFINRYLEESTDLSTDKLDLLAKLAGRDLGIVVQFFVTKLRAHVSQQGAILPDTFRNFLEIADLRICRTYDKDVFEELFVVLENMTTSNCELKWALKLLKKSSEENEKALTRPFQFETPSKSNTVLFPKNLHDITEDDESFMELILQLLVNDKVRNLLVFSEAVSYFAYQFHEDFDFFDDENSALRDVVKLVKYERNWNSVPPFAVNFYQPDSHTRGRVAAFLKECGIYHEGKPGDSHFANYTNRTLISCKEKFPETIEFTLTHRVAGCEMKGRCGMMFRTANPVNAEKTFVDLLLGIELVTENSFYPEDLHFHDDFTRFYDIHLQVSDKDHIIYPVTPGLCSDPKNLFFNKDWEEVKFLNDACYLRVIYDMRARVKNY